MPIILKPLGKIEQPDNLPIIDFSNTSVITITTQPLNNNANEQPITTITQPVTGSAIFKLQDPSFIFGVGIEDGHGKAKPEWMLQPTLEAFGLDQEVIDLLKNRTIANLNNVGFVKSSTEKNYVFVHEDGKMEVNSLDVMKLEQTEGDTLILNGGQSNGN